MTKLSGKEKEDLNKDLKRGLAKLGGNPSDPALISNLILTAGLLGKHDIILEQSQTLFYNTPENHGYLAMYAFMLRQNALDGRFDLIEEHQKRFNESSLSEESYCSEDLSISYEALQTEFEELKNKPDHHPVNDTSFEPI